MKHPIVFDFETEGIESRPKYPPKPVGLAVKWPGQKPKYLAWGHPTKNNCTRAQAHRELEKIWDSDLEVLCHNAKFDLDVAETFFELPPLPWKRVHDTLFILFLLDPHAATLSLKPSAEKHLGMPPDEQDAVKDWLVKAGVINKNENHGAHIAKAPGDVAGKYAIGDVIRTLKLHLKLHPKLDAGMRGAYDRERRLLPILLRNEREGMRVDVDGLAKELKIYTVAMAKCEAWLRKRLGVRDLNFDDDRAVGDALFNTKIVTDWVWTKGGNGRAPQRSVAKDNLGPDRFNDQKVAGYLGYRTRLQTVISNSMEPWLVQAGGGGKIYTEWNQVRHHERGRNSKGTRTGRISCSRFMNVTKNFLNKGDGFEQPKGLPPLPLVRKYILPDKGCEWNHRDFHQQEFRILAHFEDGALAKAYQENPRIDYHDKVREVIRGLGNSALADVDRVIIKNFNFGILYGEGVDLLMVKTKMDRQKVVQMKATIKQATPGVDSLNNAIKLRGRTGEPIRTWGGRLYYCEPPAIAKSGNRAGQEVTFEYKLLNYLIQGSAADATKEAIIRYDELRKESRMLVTVHDEINISSPKGSSESEDRRLRQAMESVEFDVPMLTDRKRGPNWGSLEKIE